MLDNARDIEPTTTIVVFKQALATAAAVALVATGVALVVLPAAAVVVVAVSG